MEFIFRIFGQKERSAKGSEGQAQPWSRQTLEHASQELEKTREAALEGLERRQKFVNRSPLSPKTRQ